MCCLFVLSGIVSLLSIPAQALCTIVIGVLFILPDLLYMLSDPEKIWHRWDEVSVSQKQAERLGRARSGELTPKFIDTKARYAVFVGGSTDGKYKTTLKKCTCPDFAKRGVPCKHMYYLADQMNLLSK